MAPPLLPLFAAVLASSPQEPLLPAKDSGTAAVRGEWVERRLALMGTWLDLRILAETVKVLVRGEGLRF